jgi:hypothetical protein
MRFPSTRVLALACVFGLATVLAAPGLAQAQNVVYPGGQPHPAWGFHSQRYVFPRTYSYYYNPRFNHPRHYRVVGPDGRRYWTTTVRGLPMGTPWPSY